MEPFEQLDYYTLLGVERNASSDEIKRAYRQQMNRYHPDRYVNASVDEQDYASRRSQQINEAYRVLSDFAARTAYTRQLSGGQAAGASRITPPPPAAPRDHQAELYNQAQEHMAAGRMMQAAATLRELQRLNPLYRDSAALLARAEAALRDDAAPVASASGQASPRRRILLALGGLAAAGLAAVGVRWLLPNNGATSQGTALPPATGGTPTSAAVAGGEATAPPLSASTLPATATSPPAASPTLAPSATTQPPTASPEPLTATLEPPTATSAPPTAVPTAPIVTDFVEDGPVLLADDVGSGRAFATAEGAGWSVGYINGAYQIVANQGVGRIWSFARYPGLGDHTLGVDMIADGGEAGMLLRFGGSDTYLSFVLLPAEGRWSLEQRLPGGSQVLAGDASPAISSATGAINRLAAAARGNRLVLAINNVRVFDQELTTPAPSDRYGLIGIGGANNVVALFSGLVLRGV
jgi:hypothetical protein